jgi:hypothetical protein
MFQKDPRWCPFRRKYIGSLFQDNPMSIFQKDIRWVPFGTLHLCSHMAYAREPAIIFQKALTWGPLGGEHCRRVITTGVD